LVKGWHCFPPFFKNDFRQKIFCRSAHYTRHGYNPRNW
jgi:hypothetical protein